MTLILKAIVTVCYTINQKTERKINMSVKVITADNFEKEVLNASQTVLIDFWATWCGPCQMLSPIVDEIAEENGQISVCKVNVDDQPALAQAFGIVSIPTLVVMRAGKAVNQSAPAVPKQKTPHMLAE